MALRKTLLAWLALSALVPGAPAWAQGVLDTSMPPAPQTYSGIQVIHGGVDSDQADAIKRLQSRYNLRLEISGKGGAYYVADKLKVMRGSEVIVEIPQAGPWVLMNVPPGRYTLLGDFGGTEVQRSVVVPSGGIKVSWVLPSSIP